MYEQVDKAPWCIISTDHVWYLGRPTCLFFHCSMRRAFNLYQWPKWKSGFLSAQGSILPIFQCGIEWVFGSLSTVSTPEESRDGKKDKEGDRASEEGKQKSKGSKPLMPTSTILRLLAELVRSYVGIATLIANYSYTVGQSELIKEVIFSTSA